MAIGDRLYYKALKIASSEKPNHKEVLGLLERSYKKGNGKAAYALATWYLHGKEVPKNIQKGTELLTFAADYGVPEANFDLAVSLENGIGVQKDESLAFQNYLLSAIGGDLNGTYELGRCFYYGIGITKNIELANILLEIGESSE